MIVGRDWIWLHFPKCGGTSAERMLRLNFGNDESVAFDEIDPLKVIWHENIAMRAARDPSFSAEGRKRVAIFRRLPDWIISRVHYEASRPPHRVVTRDMLLKGEFFENGGQISMPDKVLQFYDRPPVDFWVRLETMHQDFEAFFGQSLVPLERRLNENRFPYIRDIRFWFTPSELRDLYAHNPAWAAVEHRLYGRLLV